MEGPCGGGRGKPSGSCWPLLPSAGPLGWRGGKVGFQVTAARGPSREEGWSQHWVESFTRVPLGKSHEERPLPSGPFWGQ